MLARLVAKPAIEGDRPDDAQQPEDGKRPPPADQADETGGQRRRDRAAELRGGGDRTAGQAPLAGRKPASDDAGRVGKRPRLAGPEQKPNATSDQKPKAAPVSAVKTDHQSDDPRDHPPRAEAVAPVARRHFEQAVGQDEGIEDPAHVGFGERQVAANRRCRLADADAVDIEQQGQRAEKEQHAVADQRRARICCSRHRRPAIARVRRG